MKIKRNFILFIPLFLCMVLSSCKNKADIPYTETASAMGYATELEMPFAQDLCVIPSTYKEKKSSIFSGKATLIFDATAHEFIRADNVYKKVYPASITKIMTAYVAFKYANLDDIVTFGYDASHITEWGATLCGFEEGDQIKLSDLLVAFLVYSGNDAGIAIAEHISGSVEEFAQLMNKEAYALGATQSHFVNPHGLHDKEHYTTAYDIYLIFNALIQNEKFVNIISTKDVIVDYTDKEGEDRSKTFVSTNRYLNGKQEAPEGVTVIGGKTGTTFKAGSCLVLYSKGKNEHDYVSIVLKAEGGDSLFYQMTELLKLIPNE